MTVEKITAENKAPKPEDIACLSELNAKLWPSLKVSRDSDTEADHDLLLFAIVELSNLILSKRFFN